MPISNALGKPIVSEGPAKVLLNANINTGNQIATDIHLKIENSKGINANYTATSPTFGNPTTNTLNAAKTELTLEFRDDKKPVQAQSNIRLEINLFSLLNTIRVKELYLTNKGTKVGNELAIPGMDVISDPIFTLYNDFQSDIGIHGLKFFNDTPEISDINNNDLGFVGSFADFTIAAGEFISFDLPSSQPGNFLYAAMDIYDPQGGINSTYASVIYGHQSPIPEPSTLALAMLAIAITSVIRRQKLKARK